MAQLRQSNWANCPGLQLGGLGECEKNICHWQLCNHNHDCAGNQKLLLSLSPGHPAVLLCTGFQGPQREKACLPPCWFVAPVEPGKFRSVVLACSLYMRKSPWGNPHENFWSLTQGMSPGLLSLSFLLGKNSSLLGGLGDHLLPSMSVWAALDSQVCHGKIIGVPSPVYY